MNALAEGDSWPVFGRGFPTVDELRRVIDGALHSLGVMPWDPKDEILEPKAGSCMNCPKRSSQQPMLFPEDDSARNGKTPKNDRCLDPTCFERKHVAHLSVAIEAGNQTAWIYEVLVGMGAKVTVVNPGKVKAIAESRRKTDKIDARILCELLRLDALPHPVHMPGRDTRALRGLLVARRQAVPRNGLEVFGIQEETQDRRAAGAYQTRA